MNSKEQEQHGIVVVGGGICGLATALALHRKGISCLVLEKSDTLRPAGLAINIYANGWKALDQLNVGNILRAKVLLLTEAHRVSLPNSRTRIISFGNRSRGMDYFIRNQVMQATRNHTSFGSMRFTEPHSSSPPRNSSPLEHQKHFVRLLGTFGTF